MALSDEYGDDWDEWVVLWRNHNPDTQTAGLIGEGSDDSTDTALIVGVLVGVAGLAMCGALAWSAQRRATSARDELEALKAEAAAPKEFRLDR